MREWAHVAVGVFASIKREKEDLSTTEERERATED